MSTFGQVVKPTPPIEDQVVKISTNLIRIDVSVTDGKGRAVTDLKQNEIEIYENGVKQAITGFSFVSIPQPKPEEKKSTAKDATTILRRPLHYARNRSSARSHLWWMI